jgi:hypothetical protein
VQEYFLDAKSIRSHVVRRLAFVLFAASSCFLFLGADPDSGRARIALFQPAQGASAGALDMFDVTDALVSSLLDGLSGTHLLFGSLSLNSDPAGATVSVNGKDVGATPVSLRGLPQAVR